jgi:aryl-alcohol dehydrogenase-like predicted oxidoreductase
VIPYTSQANGFFSKLARGDRDLENHPFHVPANFAAGKIVLELAALKRVAPSAIVLAYLWSSRPFPVVPIIGSRTIAQLDDCIAALPVRLTETELATLECETQSGLR